MANQRDHIGSDLITSTDTRKRVRLTFSNSCFLDEMIPIHIQATDGIEVLDQQAYPPTLTVADPYTFSGDTRIHDRHFMVESMFATFNSMLYSDRPGSRYMSMVSSRILIGQLVT